MGRESEGHLQRLADAAASASVGFDTRRGLAARWRRRLEAALMFAKADAVLCALGRSEGGARTTARWCAQRMDTKKSTGDDETMLPIGTAGQLLSVPQPIVRESGDAYERFLAWRLLQKKVCAIRDHVPRLSQPAMVNIDHPCS